MSKKLYELRCFRGQDEVQNAARVQVALDRADLDVWPELLNRHLYAVAERNGEPRELAHLFHMEVREYDRYNGLPQEVLFRWALPVLPDEER